MRPQAGLLCPCLQAFRCVTPHIKINKVPKYFVEDLEAIVNVPSVLCLKNQIKTTLFFHRALVHGAGQKPYRGSSFRENFLPLLVIKSHENATHRSPEAVD